MAKSPQVPPSQVAKAFARIASEIEPHADPRLGAYLVRLVKDADELRSFKNEPEVALRNAGVDPSKIRPDVLLRVAQSVADRLNAARIGDVVMDTVSTKESSSHQERNFDNSSSWYWNKDGYNVLYDQGHSSEKTTGEIVAQDHKFDGKSLYDFDNVVRHELNMLFFPAQPLVTPQLIDKIKAAMKDRNK